MSVEVKVPVLAESVPDATLLEWKKQIGDSVNENEILIELETDKVVLEVPAPSSGILSEILKHNGEIALSEETLARIDDSVSANVPDGDAPAVATSEITKEIEAIDVKVPVLAESVPDATLLEWKKQVGEAVSENEILIELETDKVVLEVPAPGNGILAEIVKQNGEVVLSEEILARVVPSNGAASSTSATTTTPQATTGSNASSIASPSAEKIMRENSVNPDDVTSSGRDGRITKGDVVQHVTGSTSSIPTTPTTPSVPAKPAPSVSASHPTPASSTSSGSGDRVERREPMSRLRQRIAERLVDAQQSAAILTTFNELNMKPVMDLRNRYKEQFIKVHGVKLGFMSFFAKAAVIALKRFPAINAYIEGQEIVYHDYCDIGVAVSSPRGLVVPVLRNVENMGFADIENQIIAYGNKAKEGTLNVGDLTGGTFTISNGGVFGSMLSTPILNPPQSAILGMHKTQERPVVENGKLAIRPVMYLALSYDHRIVDGREAVQFLVTIKDALEDPASMMLGM